MLVSRASAYPCISHVVCRLAALFRCGFLLFIRLPGSYLSVWRCRCCSIFFTVVFEQERTNAPVAQSCFVAMRTGSLSLDLSTSNDCTETLPWLCIGPQSSSLDDAFLQEHNVTRIIDCTSSTRRVAPSQRLATSKIAVLRLPILDAITEGYHIREDFVKSTNFIEQAREDGSCCLVHCSQGMSRYARPYLRLYSHDFSTVVASVILCTREPTAR